MRLKLMPWNGNGWRIKMATFTYIRLGYKPFNGDDGGGEEAVAAFNGGTNHYLQEPSPLTIYITI